jgi:DNA helicase-2/ATP-dependent DNA helicase PcrA
MRLGARVRHPKFGDGVVVRFEGSGANVQVQVNFERAGAKWLMGSTATSSTFPANAL